MHKIIIENLKCRAFHGVYEAERRQGNDFIVNLEITTDFTKAAQDDDLTGTVNYERVCELILTEMQIPSNLLENVGQRIVDKLHNQFVEIQKIKLRISKCNPPIKADISAVSIEIES